MEKEKFILVTLLVVQVENEVSFRIRDREMAGLGMKEEETVLLTEASFPWYWLKST